MTSHLKEKQSKQSKTHSVNDKNDVDSNRPACTSFESKLLTLNSHHISSSLLLQSFATCLAVAISAKIDRDFQKNSFDFYGLMCSGDNLSAQKQLLFLQVIGFCLFCVRVRKSKNINSYLLFSLNRQFQVASVQFKFTTSLFSSN